MIAQRTDFEDTLDFSSAGRLLRRANAFFLANLCSIVDVRFLSRGDDEDDYFVKVPANRLYEIEGRLYPLERIACDRFDVMLRILPIPSKELTTTI